MLPEHSQQLLRAARSGRLLKPPAPPEDDNEMKDEEEEPKEIQSGFTIKKYVKVARHLETPEPEYLAKRRKGLPSPYVSGQPVRTVLRETKVKKLDADGNVAVYKVLVPEGQAVEGEVQPSDAAIEVAPAAAVPGTIVEGVGVVNAEGVVVANDIVQPTPPRRRPPPPKKKRGGPGRGKKKVGFVEGAPGQGSMVAATGIDPLVDTLKREEGSVAPSDGGDTPMGEAGVDEEEGSGEEGSEDEEQEVERNSTPATPSKAPTALASTAPTSVPDTTLSNVTDITPADTLPDATDPAVAPPEPSRSPTENSPIVLPTHVHVQIEQPAVRQPSSSPDLPLSAVPHSRQNSLNEIPTSLVATEATVTEPSQLESAPLVPNTTIEAAAAPIAPTELDSEPTPTVESGVVSAPLPERVSPPTVSAPPSEPDLLGSLERQLEKDNKDLAEAQ